MSTITMSRRAVIFTLVAAIILMIPVFLIPVTNHAERSAYENRRLSAPAEFSDSVLNGNFQRKTDNYFNDHIGLAAVATKITRWAQFKIFSHSTNSNLRITTQKLPFLAGEMVPEQGLWGAFQIRCQLIQDQALVAPLVTDIVGFEDIAKDLNKNIWFLIAPTKSSVYLPQLRTFMPKSLFSDCNDLDKTALFESRLNSIRSAQLHVNYPFTLLHTKRQDPAFYPAHNYHWASESVDLAVRNTFGNVGSDSPPSKRLEQASDISSLLGFPLPGPVYSLTYSSLHTSTYRPTGAAIDPAIKALSEDFFTTVKKFAGTNWVGGLSVSANRTATAPLTLVIGDSFADNVLVPVAYHYNNVLHLSSNGLSQEQLSSTVKGILDKYVIKDVLMVFRDTTLLHHAGNHRSVKAALVHAIKESEHS